MWKGKVSCQFSQTKSPAHRQLIITVKNNKYCCIEYKNAEKKSGFL